MADETYYSLLEVSETASAAEIKTAYLRIIREVHPDRLASAPAYWQRQAEEKAKEINEAYRVLSNPEKRRDYDAQLGAYRRSQNSSGGTSKAQPTGPPPTNYSYQQPQSSSGTQNNSGANQQSAQGPRPTQQQHQTASAQTPSPNAVSKPDSPIIPAMAIGLIAVILFFLVVKIVDSANHHSQPVPQQYSPRSQPNVNQSNTENIRTQSKNSNGDASPQNPTNAPDLVATALQNMTYVFRDNKGETTLTLVNGEGRVGAKSYSLEPGTITLGDLSGGGKNDAVAVLGWNGGGSGYFEGLVAVMNKNGKITNTPEFELGDRIKLNSIYIKDSVITVDMLTQGPNDGMCCPTERRVIYLRVYGTEDGRYLNRVDKEGRGRPTSTYHITNGIYYCEDWSLDANNEWEDHFLKCDEEPTNTSHSIRDSAAQPKSYEVENAGQTASSAPQGAWTSATAPRQQSTAAPSPTSAPQSSTLGGSYLFGKTAWVSCSDLSSSRASLFVFQDEKARTTVGSVNCGAHVIIQEDDNDFHWSKISTLQGVSGWIGQQYLQTGAPPDPRHLRGLIDCSVLAGRKWLYLVTPDGKITGKEIACGSAVEILDTLNGLSRIRTADGQEGWVQSLYVR